MSLLDRAAPMVIRADELRRGDVVVTPLGRDTVLWTRPGREGFVFVAGRERRGPRRCEGLVLVERPAELPGLAR